MVRVVHLTHDYEYDANLVWSIVTDYQHLETVMQGLASFKGLPDGQLVEGQKLNVDVSLFGKLPFQPYFMSVEHCDNSAFKFVSLEHGAGVQLWCHSLSVIRDSSGIGCQIIEDIEIEAGLLTPIFVLWARYMYKARHKRRLVLFRQLGDGNS